MNSPTQARLAGLDGWRTISVALVISGHLAVYSSIATTSAALAPFGWFATLGVDIFFVISGFVIVRGLISEFGRVGRLSFTSFYVRRFFRIFPPLALYVLAVVILALLGILQPDAISALRALTFTCNIPGAHCGGWFGGHTWSLSAEEQFYLMAPLLLVAVSRARREIAGLAVVALPLVIELAPA